MISNGTKAICLIFQISFVSDSCAVNLDFDITFLKIGQILRELQKLEDQNAVNHETSELFHFGCYMDVHKRVESFIHMLNCCQDFFIFTQLIYDNLKTYKMTDLRDWIKVQHINTPSS